MKNLFNFFLLLLFSSTMFYGCGSAKSFKQKHYNNSYYVGISKQEKVKNKEVVFDKEIINSEMKETNSLEHAKLIPTMGTEPNLESQNQMVNIETDNLSSGEPDERSPLSYSSSKNLEEDYEKKEGEFQKNSIPNFFKNKVNKQKSKIKSAANEGDALSLLWIVIIIILILWLIGWGVGGLGLGGFIHILALIALILLILWLLRII